MFNEYKNQYELARLNNFQFRKLQKEGEKALAMTTKYK